MYGRATGSRLPVAAGRSATAAAGTRRPIPDYPAMMRLSCVALLPLVAGHGSLTIPQVRNSVDRHAREWMGVRSWSLSFVSRRSPAACFDLARADHAGRPRRHLHLEARVRQRGHLTGCWAAGLPEGPRLPWHGPLGPGERDLRHRALVVPGGLLVLERHRAVRRGPELLRESSAACN